MFPYQKDFEEWCKNVKHFSKKTINLNIYVVNNFFAYFTDKLKSNSFASVNSIDIRGYIDNLYNQHNLSARTCNKYLTNIKRFFMFLYVSNYIDKYPVANIRGISYNRHLSYYINWLNLIPSMIGIVAPDTIKLLTAFSLGYEKQDLLNLKINIIDQVHNIALHNYLAEYLNFSKTSNSFFTDQRGNSIKTLMTIRRHTKPDEKVLGMPLSPYKLRQGYIYTKVSDHTLSDDELAKKLKCSQKRLAYYKNNAQILNLIDFKINKKK